MATQSNWDLKEQQGVILSIEDNPGTPSMDSVQKNADLQRAQSSLKDLKSVMPETSQGNQDSCPGRELRRHRTPSRIMLCCREPEPSTKGLGPPRVQHPAPAALSQPGTKLQSAARAHALEPCPATSSRPENRPELPRHKLHPAARNPAPEPKPADRSSRRAAQLHPTASHSASDVCVADSLRPQPAAERHPAVRHLVPEGGSVTRGRPATRDHSGSGPGPAARRRRGSGSGPAARRRRGSGPSPLPCCCCRVPERRSGTRSCPASGPGPSSGSSPIHLQSGVIQRGPARCSSSVSPDFVLRSCSTQRGSASRSSPSQQGPTCQSPPSSPVCGLQRLVHQNSSSSPNAEATSFNSEPGWHAVRMRASSPSPPGRYFLYRLRLAGGSLLTYSSSSPSSLIAPPSASSPVPLSSPVCPAALSFPESPGRRNSPTLDVPSGNTSSSFGGLGSISTPSPSSLRRAFLPELYALDSAPSGNPGDMENTPPRPQSPGL